MKKTSAKILSFFMGIMLVITGIGPVAKAEEAAIVASGICGDNLTWTFDEDSILRIDGTGEMYDYNWSPYGSGRAPWAGKYDSQIQKVVVSEGVTSIGKSAFSFCQCVDTVELPESITSIGDNAFYFATRLQAVTLPDKLEYLGESAFGSCELIRSITIPEKINYIPRGCFIGCDNLRQVTVLSDYIEYVGKQAFYSCWELKEVDFRGQVNEVKELAFRGCDKLVSFGRLTAMKKIGEKAFETSFEKANLTDISFIKGMEYIGTHAFDSEFLTTVTLPETVQNFEDWPFGENMKEVTVETSANITIYDDYFQREGQDASAKIYVHKVKTTQKVLVNNLSSRDIYVDGELVKAGETAISNPKSEETTTPSETESTTDTEDYPLSGGSKEVGCWAFDEDTATLTLSGETIEMCRCDHLVNKVKHIVFEEGCKYFVDYGYDYVTPFTNVETLSLPSTLINAPLAMVKNSRNLTSITVDEENPYFKSFNGDLYYVVSLDGKYRLVKYAVGKKDTVVTLASGTIEIGDEAFSNERYVEEIVAPKSVRTLTIPFNNTSINKITVLNPNCDISVSRSTNMTVCSYKGSLVEKTCKSKGLNFEYVETKPIKGIEITKQPNETEFVKGRKADFSGMELKVTYEDGLTYQLHTGYTISGADTNTTGTKTVMISYEGETVFTEINVVDIDENDLLDITESKEVTVSNSEKCKYLYFVPKNSGIYQFYSSGSYDTVGTLMDMNNKVLKTDDDSGNKLNYSLKCELEEGKTYILCTTLYMKGECADFTVHVKLEKLSGECIHSFDKYIKKVEPTCTSEGYTVYQCSKCGEEIETDYVEKIEHAYSVYQVVEPTCISEGYTRYRCDNCGMTKIDNVVAALGHSYVDTVVEATETEYGYVLHECTRCTYSYKDNWVEPKGLEIIMKNQETTTEDGNQETKPKETTAASTVTEKLKKPTVKAKRTAKKIKLTFKSRSKNVKYQIYIKKNGKYKKVKTISKNKYVFKHKKKCYIKVRCVKYVGKRKIYSKFKKISI